jgi:hypothetical protein
MQLTIGKLCLLIAVILFIAAAIGVDFRGISLVAAGLAFSPPRSSFPTGSWGCAADRDAPLTERQETATVPQSPPKILAIS